MNAAEGQRRFAIRYNPILRPLLVVLGMGPAFSGVTVTADELHVAMGWAFQAHIPRGAVVAANPARIPLGRGIGVHGWAGTWAVNGGRAGGVRLDIAPPARARASGLPVQLRTLWLSLADPDGFLAGLGLPGAGSTAISAEGSP